MCYHLSISIHMCSVYSLCFVYLFEYYLSYIFFASFHNWIIVPNALPMLCMCILIFISWKLQTVSDELNGKEEVEMKWKDKKMKIFRIAIQHHNHIFIFIFRLTVRSQSPNVLPAQFPFRTSTSCSSCVRHLICWKVLKCKKKKISGIKV